MENEQSTVLVVDDDNSFLEIITTALQAKGLTVHAARGGAEALELLKTLRPDLIILDVNMPNMSGVEVLSKIKESIQPLPRVIFLTSYGEPQKDAKWLDEKFAREIGAIDYINKTDDLEKITNEIQRVIAPAQD